jgi:hypothetical protein
MQELLGRYRRVLAEVLAVQGLAPGRPSSANAYRGIPGETTYVNRSIIECEFANGQLSLLRAGPCEGRRPGRTLRP